MSIDVKNIFRGWGLLAVAVAVALLAFWVSTLYLDNRESAIRDMVLSEKGVTSGVVVATMDLPVGTIIGPDNMALAQVPEEHVSAFAITPDLFDRVNGQVLRFPMSKGEPLLSHFVAGEVIERFSDLLEDGERAITLEIDNLNSASGMLVAGDYVDLLLLVENEDESDDKEDVTDLRPILQNVRVLSVDSAPLLSKKQDFVIESEASRAFSTVTVGVSFKDAETIVLSRDLGEIVFLLRNKGDHQQLNIQKVSSRDLAKATGNVDTYLFFSASNLSEGGIKPATKSIVKNQTLNHERMVFSKQKSQPISIEAVSNFE